MSQACSTLGSEGPWRAIKTRGVDLRHRLSTRPFGLVSDRNVSRMSCPLPLASPGVSVVSWLQLLAVWPLAKGELQLLCLVFPKGKVVQAEISVCWGEMLGHGLG